MGGCFGNNAYDRSMEFQLFRYLDSIDDELDCDSCARHKYKQGSKQYKKFCEPCADSDEMKNYKEKKAVKK